MERKGSGLLPALASPAQLPHAHARLPLAGVSYPDVVAFLGGLLPLSRRNTPWGPGPGLRAQLRDRRFHRDQMVVALAIELLFARDPAIVQYGLVTLIWLSDERTAARRAIVEMGAVPRIVDLCRVRPDSVPRHITSVRCERRSHPLPRNTQHSPLASPRLHCVAGHHLIPFARRQRAKSRSSGTNWHPCVRGSVTGRRSGRRLGRSRCGVLAARGPARESPQPNCVLQGTVAAFTIFALSFAPYALTCSHEHLPRLARLLALNYPG